MAEKKFRFKGNESFNIREGWINKGLHAVHENPRVFGENYGADALGVGPNMAKSIRFWMRCCGLIIDKKTGCELSAFGEQVYRYDPYIEQDFTLWMIHYNIVKHRNLATAWFLFFNKLTYEEFTKEEMISEVKDLALDYADGVEFSEKSVEADCDSILHMYVRKRDKIVDPEDKNVSPFAKLGLIHMTANHYEKKQPNLNRLPVEIVWLLLVEQMGIKSAIHLDELLTSPDSPGKVLNLKQVALMNILEQLEREKRIVINRTAGLNMIYMKDKILPRTIIEDYYQSL